MLGQDSVTVLVMVTLGVAIVIGQPFSTSTLKPSQGLGPEHCKICGSKTDDVSKKEGLTHATISSCNLVNGISPQGINASLFECVCKSQFSGTYNGTKSDGIKCYDVDECDLNTDWCDDHAKCINKVGGFDCQCAEGFFSKDGGKTCDDILECASEHKCGYEPLYGDFGSCYEIYGSYSCRCNSGFLNFNQTAEGNKGSCENIDECTTGVHTCKGGHKNCRDTLGSYECYCDAGYYNDTSNSSEGMCENINECAVNGTNNCGYHTKCVDTEGSYECHCEGDGYRFVNNSNNTVCEDINECAVNGTNNCGAFTKCVNTDGSFECRCEGDGFRFVHNSNTVCEDYNECTEGSYKCNDASSLSTYVSSMVTCQLIIAMSSII